MKIEQLKIISLYTDAKIAHNNAKVDFLRHGWTIYTEKFMEVYLQYMKAALEISVHFDLYQEFHLIKEETEAEINAVFNETRDEADLKSQKILNSFKQYYEKTIKLINETAQKEEDKKSI